MVFDIRAAKALTAGEHLTVADAPGLRLVATESTKTWTYRYKSPVTGSMRQVRLGRWPSMGLPAALAAWERKKAERGAGRDPAVEKRAAKRTAKVEGYTVRRVVEDYLASYEGSVKPRTYAEAARTLEVGIPPIETRIAASITRADAFDLLDKLRGTPVQAAALRRQLGASWDHALDSGRLPPEVPNWWRLVLRGKLPSKGKKVAGKNIGAGKRVLTQPELSLLIPWLPNFSRDIDDALTLYLWTCCRGAEIVAMEAHEITEEADGLWWTVPREKLKMLRNPLTTDLRVPLVGRARSVVMRRLDVWKAGWLFPSRGKSGHIEQKAIGVATWMHSKRNELKPEWVRPRLPVAEFSPHDLRRTSRTVLSSLGCPFDIGELILGHLPPGTQPVYDRHGYDAERRLWLTRLSDHLESLVKSPG
jgi:integrase